MHGLIMTDIGNGSDVKVNDEVIIFGKDYPADTLSNWSNDPIWDHMQYFFKSTESIRKQVMKT